MGLDIKDLEKRIERKISNLEVEKNRLKEDLKVVRQASIIADEFQSEEGSTERGFEDSRPNHWADAD
jgi:hypothetical protein